ncbi:hypothetical protein, partial [Enterococcus mundtii]|uniref:hypothetical protein n=1 Tax=Enterococcus mundtii TaxID=53346 RepID=UPI003BF9BFF2
GLASRALNLRKLGKYMERNVRIQTKTSPILTKYIKIGLISIFEEGLMSHSLFYFLYLRSEVGE